MQSLAVPDTICIPAKVVVKLIITFILIESSKSFQLSIFVLLVIMLLPNIGTTIDISDDVEIEVLLELVIATKWIWFTLVGDTICSSNYFLYFSIFWCWQEKLYFVILSCLLVFSSHDAYIEVIIKLDVSLGEVSVKLLLTISTCHFITQTISQSVLSIFKKVNCLSVFIQDIIIRDACLSKWFISVIGSSIRCRASINALIIWFPLPEVWTAATWVSISVPEITCLTLVDAHYIVKDCLTWLMAAHAQFPAVFPIRLLWIFASIDASVIFGTLPLVCTLATCIARSNVDFITITFVFANAIGVFLLPNLVAFSNSKDEVDNQYNSSYQQQRDECGRISLVWNIFPFFHLIFLQGFFIFD